MPNLAINSANLNSATTPQGVYETSRNLLSRVVTYFNQSSHPDHYNAIPWAKVAVGMGILICLGGCFRCFRGMQRRIQQINQQIDQQAHQKIRRLIREFDERGERDFQQITSEKAAG